MRPSPFSRPIVGHFPVRSRTVAAKIDVGQYARAPIIDLFPLETRGDRNLGKSPHHTGAAPEKRQRQPRDPTS